MSTDDVQWPVMRSLLIVIHAITRGAVVVRTLAYHVASPGSIPGAGGEDYKVKNLALYIRDCYICVFRMIL